jgi:hypothetical protein
MAHAELKPHLRYDMPPGFGPSVAPEIESDFEIHASDVQFETTPEAAQTLMPEWFRPAPRPMVSIGYRSMLGMKWMGGRNYQIVTIRISSECNLDSQRGVHPFALVIWESDCAPILAGRELMGAPKLFAGIPAITVSESDHAFECREYDALLVRAQLSGLRALSASELAGKREQQKNGWIFYWKYIPGVGGEPDANYPVAIKMHTPFARMWRGQGAFELGRPAPAAAPYSHRIVQRVAELPRRSEVTASAWHAPGCTLFRDQTRRLDR